MENDAKAAIERAGMENGVNKERRKRERRAAPSRGAEPFLRAANEDDDGYDPYSDRPAEDPLYEEDPWR